MNNGAVWVGFFYAAALNFVFFISHHDPLLLLSERQ